MSYYEIRQEGHPEAWASFSYCGEHPADRNASRTDALGRALEQAKTQSLQRERPWVVDHVQGDERWQLARYPGRKAPGREPGS